MSLSFDGDQDHYLTSYLTQKLPNLGLDPDTYGPYVTGLFPIDPDEYENDVDEDELTNLFELLKSSSETHADDDDDIEDGYSKNENGRSVWSELRNDILQIRNDFIQTEKEKKEKQKDVTKIENQKRLELAREEAKQQELLKSNEKETKRKEKDVRIAALLDQYGYEKDYDEEGDDNNTNKDSSGGIRDGGMKSNQQVAAEHAKKIQEKVRAESTKSFQNKKLAREATNKQKKDKLRLKEERRKRAAKGERRG